MLAGHMDVNALDLAGAGEDVAELERSRRTTSSESRATRTEQSPWHAASFLELKTVWHPIGVWLQTSVSRFSEAISEGDGISVIPVLEGDVGALAALAEEAGAEALRSVPRTSRRRVRGPRADPRARSDPQAVADAGADAVVVVTRRRRTKAGSRSCTGSPTGSSSTSPSTSTRRKRSSEALERIDPEIVLISGRSLDDDEEDLELTLDLLADVPAGKLVVSEARIVSHDRSGARAAGVDAILVHGLARDPDFGAVSEELVHGPEAGL